MELRVRMWKFTQLKAIHAFSILRGSLVSTLGLMIMQKATRPTSSWSQIRPPFSLRNWSKYQSSWNTLESFLELFLLPHPPLQPGVKPFVFAFLPSLPIILDVANVLETVHTGLRCVTLGQ